METTQDCSSTLNAQNVYAITIFAKVGRYQSSGTEGCDDDGLCSICEETAKTRAGSSQASGAPGGVPHRRGGPLRPYVRSTYAVHFMLAVHIGLFLFSACGPPHSHACGALEKTIHFN